jgi:hypothetical protein
MPSPTAFVLVDESTKSDTSRIRGSLTSRHPGAPVSISEEGDPAVIDITAPLRVRLIVCCCQL